MSTKTIGRLVRRMRRGLRQEPREIPLNAALRRDIGFFPVGPGLPSHSPVPVRTVSDEKRHLRAFRHRKL
ncbi:hypothetical protein [Pontivivens ytuae]|uniref:Uncharacterized protein n=1 Tax=Pontivivens ytuae TaxID=2789856 RepID=A0A7S9LRQ5_9RHOB|nr:hypothetical protein [Pontivivens ytuae]QPH54028.1 hypothetical protein I0K15_20025 [Pontivivens ytuae]